ncbi:hypothetical protein QMA60_06280 [Leuconostoc suionicum]|uniref:hypothetical protein n=1 Tax=Leuconostoc suionicum TaxID=1511761 RepID=UPI0024AE227C|nr:hypothetical protein [Leuconostoc suionicum]MDI6497913.1 hypothetical protein [Leuconostoc suionicum]MDI6499994.1 hypothetical protein [Leuconostoc suionicum]MDI6502339.1 hypothetical protein [Leuconostoc suionicum]MDI6613972.1 hypothetical protein [Leuconostoc suionicum]MDI6665225.1 hypothetical protein [Leuconostoc suionicum]
MTIEEYTKQSIERVNKQAAVSGAFTHCFDTRAQSERKRTSERKRRLKELVRSNVTEIDVLAQYFMISTSTMCKVIYQTGMKIKNSRVVV